MPDTEPAHRLSPAWGFLAIAFYLVHAGYHVLHHQPENVLWSCHLGAVLVGTGLIFDLATIHAIGFLWLLVGNTIWLVDLASGGEFLPTSLLPHIGALLLSIFGLERLGMPRHTWWKAALGLVVLQRLTHYVTPAASNVNLAFDVWSGWERIFPSYPAFELTLGLSVCSIFFVTERLTRRVIADG